MGTNTAPDKWRAFRLIAGSIGMVLGLVCVPLTWTLYINRQSWKMGSGNYWIYALALTLAFIIGGIGMLVGNRSRPHAGTSAGSRLAAVLLLLPTTLLSLLLLDNVSSDQFLRWPLTTECILTIPVVGLEVFLLGLIGKFVIAQLRKQLNGEQI